MAKHGTSLYLSVGKFCPCKIRVLDNLFDNVEYAIPQYDKFDEDERRVIVDLRILDHPNEKKKNVNLIPLDIPTANKQIFDTLGYKRISFLEHDTSIVLSVTDSTTVTEFSKHLEFFLKECFPDIPARTFLNYCRYVFWFILIIVLF